jgi:hypothetical protein
MDSLKFAFDTLIVGALALPWLALFMRMFFEPSPAPSPETRLAFLSALPDHTREAVAGVLIVALGYFLGSAVTRISNDFFNDELWFILPTESAIRTSVYSKEYCNVHTALKTLNVNLPLVLGHAAVAENAVCTATGEYRRHVVSELFRIQEGRLLLAGEDKLTRLKEFHDQIVILRGSVLNGTVLAVLSLFGICACYRVRFSGRLRQAICYLPAGALLAYGLFSLARHFSDLWKAGTSFPYDDPPLAELVLILLGICGFLVCRRTSKEDLRVFRNVWILAVVLSLIAYGAWWWTEVMYDEQVIHSNLQASVSQR